MVELLVCEEVLDGNSWLITLELRAMGLNICSFITALRFNLFLL